MTGEHATIVVRRLRDRPALIVALAVILAIIAGTAGYQFAQIGKKQQTQGSAQHVLYWYDPMVPSEHYAGPGKSSMGMALQPKYSNEGAQGGVTVSPNVIQNLGIRLAKVEVQNISPVVRSVGHVDFDQRLVTQVQTLTPGFVESLSVRAEGEPIAAGRVIAEVYSPELLAAENEYRALLASKSIVSANLRSATRQRLLLLGAPGSLVALLDHGGPPQRTYPVITRTAGVITTIGARPGAQVSPGQSIVTIQGLGQVLVIADVPEALLGNIHVGQRAEITFPAYPTDTRHGVVDYIFPTLTAQGRTAQVRITLPNPGAKLKQGMFANVTMQAVGGSAIVVPSEAVIDTGRRQVAIVKRGNGFVPQEVKTGRDFDEYTEVLAGLQPGEEVVSSGQFLIDSEASLQGFLDRLKPSRPGATQ